VEDDDDVADDTEEEAAANIHSYRSARIKSRSKFAHQNNVFN